MIYDNQQIDKKKAIIKKEKVIVVEGKDDETFFNKLLDKLNILDVQIIGMEGKNNFKKGFEYIQDLPGFNVVKRLAIILDADKNYQSTKQSVIANTSKALKVSKDPLIFSSSNPSVAYFIMPNNKDKGMLETLCIASQKNSPEIKQVDKFISEVDSDNMIKEKPKNKDKAKAQAYLSIMPKIACGMAYGIVKNYWNLEHPDFQKLINFLKSA